MIWPLQPLKLPVTNWAPSALGFLWPLEHGSPSPVLGLHTCRSLCVGCCSLGAGWLLYKTQVSAQTLPL